MSAKKLLLAVCVLLLLAGLIATLWTRRGGAPPEKPVGENAARDSAPPGEPGAAPSPKKKAAVPAPPSATPAKPPNSAVKIAVRGRVFTAGGKPAGDIFVWADSYAPYPGSGPRRFTDAEGRYSRPLPPGDHVLKARGPHTTTASVAVAVPATGDAVSAPDLELSAGGVIRGRVLDGEGKPLAYVRVRAIAEEGEEPGILLHHGHRLLIGEDDAVSAKDGTFELRDAAGPGPTFRFDFATTQGTSMPITYEYFCAQKAGTKAFLPTLDGTISGLPAGDYTALVKDKTHEKTVSFRVTAGRELALDVHLGK